MYTVCAVYVFDIAYTLHSSCLFTVVPHWRHIGTLWHSVELHMSSFILTNNTPFSAHFATCVSCLLTMLHSLCMFFGVRLTSYTLHSTLHFSAISVFLIRYIRSFLLHSLCTLTTYTVCAVCVPICFLRCAGHS